MLFHSNIFIFLFVPIVLILYYAFYFLEKKNFAIFILVLASLFFYGYWDYRFLPLITASIVFNYTISKRMAVAEVQAVAKRLLILGVVCNLGALFYFKYLDFSIGVLREFAGLSLSVTNVILPIGISFFTFQQIAYLVDIYTKRPAEQNLLRYALFVCFFPQLIAGPIVHHSEMMPQFRRVGHQRVLENIAIGLTIFSIGLAKKVILADTLSSWASPLFDIVGAGQSIMFFEAWAAALTYSLQIYFDFSGYSDMAIGLGRMFGIVLPINFSSPYKASSIIDFWRRWHMTLSRFLRDYVYIPFGGNQRGRRRRYANVAITMLLGGIWHGAGWTYFVWGAIHGAAIVINILWRNLGLQGRLGQLLSWGLTILLVVIAWVPFRADSLAAANLMYAGMLGLNGISVPLDFAGYLDALPKLADALHISAVGVQVLTREWLLTLILGAVIAFLFPNTQTLMRDVNPGFFSPGYPKHGITVFKTFETLRWQQGVLAATLVGIVFVLSVTWNNDVSEFIYFQF